MQIAIASGKGGTGKTTVAVSLAQLVSQNGVSVAYLDCDVEEPNGHIFLKPEFDRVVPVGVQVPKVDEDKCTHCNECGVMCRYSAIVSMGRSVLVFPELCHGCGGCSMVCEPGAIEEVLHETGTVATGTSGKIAFVHGLLKIGQAMSAPVIRQVKAAGPMADVVIVDAPPGTSCPVIESVKGADYVILVTEPTPFGLNDLRLAVDMVRALAVPFGVVINRAGLGGDELRTYCESEDIKILAQIPDDRRIAEAYSRGEVICAALPEYESLFASLYVKVSEEVIARQ